MLISFYINDERKDNKGFARCCIPSILCSSKLIPFHFYLGLLGLPSHSGTLLNLSSFDNKFFDINDYDANNMDPTTRLMHEVAYETILDAGIDPADLRGTRTSVIIGGCYEDTKQGQLEDDTKCPTYLQLHIDRIAYSFDFRGPSWYFDTACASSFSAFHECLLGLEAGLFDQAILFGTALHLVPLITRGFLRMNMISPDGIPKCLDDAVNGYCRSEGIAALFVQKESEAKRIYAKPLNTRTNCDGYKGEGITFPRASTQQKLMEETFNEIDLDPFSIDYIEAHITGTVAGDPIECEAIMNAYRKNCKSLEDCKPVKIGCLKSNIGHTEGASGACTLTKVAKIFQTGLIPPNLNYHVPNQKIDGLKTGILEPVTKLTPFNGDIIPCDSFGFGGVNVHAIMSANPKRISSSNYLIADDVPRIINFCNRTKEGINETFNYYEKNVNKISQDELKLVHDVSKIDPLIGMKFRAFMLIDKNNTIIKKVSKKIAKKRPIWLLLPPLGSQWSEMGKGLMQLKVFADSIDESSKIVQLNYGYNLKEILLDSNQELMKNDIITSLLGIVSIQIALIDLLNYLNVKFDGIIGHSVGEAAAGYADGCSSREQTIKTAYWLAKVGLELRKSKGLMAAVGLSWKSAQIKCPEGVEPACDNCSDMITVAGDYDKVIEMVKELQNEGIFARQVSCCEVAYHCSNVEACFDGLIKHLSPIYAQPKPRSNRWMSTSIKTGDEDKPEFTHLTAQYYANMVVSPVRFYETIKAIPKDAAILELGPSTMLIGMIRKELGSSLDYIMMMKRDDADNNLHNILTAIGGIYMAGHWPAIDKLYPSVQYPVCRETASLSSMIKWKHDKKWHVCLWPEHFNQCFFQGVRTVDIVSKRFLAGHIIDGRTLFPATGYLRIFWDYLMYTLGEAVMSEKPVEFRNVRIHRATLISAANPAK